MAVVRWDPFRDLTTLQGELNRLFSRAGGDVAERQLEVDENVVTGSQGSR